MFFKGDAITGKGQGAILEANCNVQEVCRECKAESMLREKSK